MQKYQHNEASILQHWHNPADAITEEFAYEYIGKLFTTPENGHALRMDTKIFTGEATIRYFCKLAGRTGHAFKKMTAAKFAAVTFKN